jgi:PAS domain S-box-containing protein
MTERTSEKPADGRSLQQETGEKSKPGASHPELSPFSVVFEHHQAVALLVDPESGALVDANPAAAVFYGYTLEQLRSMNMDQIEQTSREAVLEECALAARQVRQRFEVPHRLASGEDRFVEVTSSPIRLEGITYLCAIVMDASRRRMAEQERERSAKHLATLLEVSQAMTMTLDLPSVSQAIIEKASTLVGLETGAIYLLRGPILHLEATTPPLPPGMPEEFREARLEDHPHIQESFRRGQPLAIEETADVSFTPQERAIIDMRGLRSLLYIPLIIERRPVGVLIVGSVGHPRNYSPSEIDLCRAFSIQAAVTAENAVMFDTKTRYARELEARIAERDRAQRERSKLQEQLFEAQRRETIGTLASGIAHDINNILGIIVGNASMLSAGRGDPEKDAKRIEAIMTATDRATQVVTQLLTIARKTEMVRRPTDLNKLVEELGKLIEETFPRHITVHCDLDPMLSPVNADAGQIHQVLLNLCVNARDAMPNKGVLSLATRTVDGRRLRLKEPRAEARPYVEVCVKDTGTGMDEATRSRIFTPFFTTKGMGKGTGLGLAVSLGIVESHSGFIDVTTVPGAGSEFRIYLPSLSEEQAPRSASRATNGPGPHGNETVLVVEDEPLLRESLTEALEHSGYRVLKVSSGEEALERYRNRYRTIDLVVSDYGLPAMDGEEFFRRLRSEGATMPFIMMTGFIEPQKRSELLQAGVHAVLLKPFAPVDLLMQIRQSLDRRPA